MLQRGFSRCSRHVKRSLPLTPLPSRELSSLAPANGQPTVSTYRRRRIPTESPSHRIPLSIVDIHLRNEELPFCYFFDETLDEEALEASLRLVLRDFPQTGGSICQSHTAIQCQPDDTVHLSFGKINTTLEEWQSQPRGHIHQSFSASNSKSRADGGHPVLLPLFDSLFEDKDQSLVKIRVTYFQNKGTAIAVNFCHALGDTATCVHFVQSWGKQMRQKRYQKVHADRSKACVSGMMTTDIADIMGLTPQLPLGEQAASIYQSYLPDMLREWLFNEVATSASTETTTIVETETVTAASAEQNLPGIAHEYVRLPFPVQLLTRLKDMGSSSCQHDDSFVSTNDMLTSYGWLLKRHLSEQADHNLSMVVNLRGRSGVNPTLFGNGISHVVASTPEIYHHRDQPDSPPSDMLFTDSLCLAAKSIRKALQLGLSDLPDALSASQMGRALAAPANSTQSFSTTSWGQFPLYQIRFAEHALSGFHGHPAHPLPEGRTFASVITPCPDGGCWYEMLLPSDQAQQARDRHVEMTAICMAWMEPTTSSQ